MVASPSKPQGILSTGAPKRDTHVTINAPEPAQRNRDTTPPPPATQVSNNVRPLVIHRLVKVTATAVNFPIKDEVEMLRAGAKNVHGDNVHRENNAKR